MALVVAIISAVRKVSVQPGMVICGDISIQGNVKGVRTLTEACQLAMENGARKVLVPVENRKQLPELSGDVAERLDPVFFSDPAVAVQKAFGGS